MSQNLTFIEHSVFLCQHQALKSFAQNYNNNYDLSSNQYWSIVCERKEDIVTIRNQLFLEQKSLNMNDTILSGISIFTLDTLAQKICASLTHMDNEKIPQEIPQSLFKPYIDITHQEKLVETILNLFGYNNNDSLALAKQILTLIDVQLPQDINLVDLILSTQNEHNSKTIQAGSEISLKQIFATIQQSRIELAQYARFQVLVHYFEYINDTCILPFDIFSSPILWISAPEYSENNDSLKPGNFQSYLVEDFKNEIKRLRKPSSQYSIFYDSRTVIKDQELNSTSNLNVYLSSNNHSFVQTTENLMTQKNTDTFILLADFDPQSFQFTRFDASGTYSITKKDLENWKNNLINPYFEESKRQIDEKYRNYVDILSYVQSFESLHKIAEIYSLNSIELNETSNLELFMSQALREKITIGNAHSLENAPKVLSYFNGNSLPNKIICIGRPHNPVSQSFNVKILNQVFFLLKQKGVDLEIPASETMYRLFWKNLIYEIKQIEFWIPDKKELDKFPNYLKISNTYNLNSPVPSHFNFKFQQILPVEHKTQKQVSITQFEEYVFCPHKYYLKNILNIKKREPLETVNFKEIGIKMHKICEQLITRLVILFGNKGYLTEMPDILTRAIELLQNEKLFLSFDIAEWLEAFNTVSQNSPVILTFKEAIELIWEATETSSLDNQTNFLVLQQREILKRTFLKFLITEQDNLNNNSKLKVGLYRELPIQFEYAGLEFFGRIDRIDLTLEGLEIIDYKTSNILKSQKEIAIYPSIASKNNKLKFSVQGALYSYGFAKTLTVPISEAGEDILLNKIKYYSLYFFKNLDKDKSNCFKFNFEPSCENQNSSYAEIEHEYKNYVQNFLDNQFSPKPIQGESTCLFCEYKTACPKTYMKQPSSNLTEETYL